MTEDWREMLRWKGYVVERCIGVGGFSKVYLIREGQTGREFAGKVSNQKEMLRKEYEILQKISHPLFPRAYDFWEGIDTVIMKMEYVPGIPLDRLMYGIEKKCGQNGMNERRGLSGQAVLPLGIQLAEGLSYLQRLPSPVLYRDLKPENIMVQEDGSIKLLDFGCAIQYEQPDYRQVGTPGFAAPEQLAGGAVDFSADVYGLGQTLKKVLKGRDHSRESKRLRRILALCTRQEIEERPPDMDAVLDLLRGQSTKNYPMWKKNIRR